MTLTDYSSRKEGGRGLASIEDRIDASIQRLENYIQKHDGGLITAVGNDTDNMMDNKNDRWSTGRCAKNLNMTISTNGICTTQHLS